MGGGERPPVDVDDDAGSASRQATTPSVHFYLDNVYVPSPEDPNGEVHGYLSIINQDPKVGTAHLVAWTPHYMLRSLTTANDEAASDYVSVSSALGPPPDGIATTYAIVMALPSFRSLLVQRLPDGVKITPRIAGGIPLQPFIVRGPDPESSCDAFIAALGACVDVIRSPTNPDLYLLEAAQGASALLLPPFAPSASDTVHYDDPSSSDTEARRVERQQRESEHHFPSILPEFSIDPVFMAVEEAKWAVLERFSRVTQLYKNATSFLFERQPDRRPSGGEPARPVYPTTARRASGSGIIQMEPTTSADTDIGAFEILSSEKTPHPTPSQRDPALMITGSALRGLRDSTGRVVSESDFRRRVFFGGATQDTRAEVWKYLLGFYPFNSTEQERTTITAQKRALYETYKRQWLSITPDQESHFSKFKENRHRIEKDVLRTDRTHPAFADENGPLLCRLRDILLTYTFYNFDLGYVQGMSDLLVPILLVLDPNPASYTAPVPHPATPSVLESESFWLFAALMDMYQTHFFRDQKGMHRNLSELRELIRFLDPEFYSILEARNAQTFFFCFRWLLILYKREFPVGEPLFLVWDAMLSRCLTKRFHIFLAAGALILKRKEFMAPDMDFDDMLRYVNNLAGSIDADSFLKKGEEMVYKLAGRQDAPQDLRELLG